MSFSMCNEECGKAQFTISNFSTNITEGKVGWKVGRKQILFNYR